MPFCCSDYRRVVAQKVYFVGGGEINFHFTQFGGVNRIFKPNAQNIKTFTLSKLLHELQPNSAAIKTKTDSSSVAAMRVQYRLLSNMAESWWRGTVVERQSLAGELSLSCARPAADG